MAAMTTAKMYRIGDSLVNMNYVYTIERTDIRIRVFITETMYAELKGNSSLRLDKNKNGPCWIDFIFDSERDAKQEFERICQNSV